MQATNVLLHDYKPSADFLEDVLQGLREDPKRLSCKYFYDQRGCQLFEQICELDEYYLTRTELAIMRRSADQMADQLGPDCMLIEFGSGSSIKTRILLDALDRAAAYVPVDIARQHLRQTAVELSRRYPRLQILPVCADFSSPFEVPRTAKPARRRVVYFPGSTIGNFTHDEAVELLRRIASLCGPGGGLLIGVDLQKDRRILEAAYNDAQGVTAEFNLNVLRRINAELDGDFDLEAFEHRARYSDEAARIEMHLVSLAAQSVTVGDEQFEFASGESICTEYSHKYTSAGFSALAAPAGFQLRRTWTDDDRLFAVLYLHLP